MRSLNYWRRILYLHPKLNSDFRVSKYLLQFQGKMLQVLNFVWYYFKLGSKKTRIHFSKYCYFFLDFLEKYCQNLSIIQNKQIWNMCIAFWWCNSIHNCPPGCSTYFIWWLERCRLAFMWLMMHNTIFE